MYYVTDPPFPEVVSVSILLKSWSPLLSLSNCRKINVLVLSSRGCVLCCSYFLPWEPLLACEQIQARCLDGDVYPDESLPSKQPNHQSSARDEEVKPRLSSPRWLARLSQLCGWACWDQWASSLSAKLSDQLTLRQMINNTEIILLSHWVLLFFFPNKINLVPTPTKGEKT